MSDPVSAANSSRPAVASSSFDVPSACTPHAALPLPPFANAGDMQRQFEGIIRSASEAIITIDEAQTILIFNPTAEKLFGCTAQDAIGTSLERFIPQRYRHAHAQQVRQFGVTGISERQMGKRRPLFGLRADGTEFPIEASISQFVECAGPGSQDGDASRRGGEEHGDGDGSGDTGRRVYTVLLRDITARLQARAELQASRNELRHLSASIQAAREDEQSRIARELHDDLGQRLTALKVDLSLLEADLDEEASRSETALHRWRGRTSEMKRLIDDTVQAVRRIAADLRPVMLDDLGLVAAIDWLASEWRRRHGIVVTVRSGASGEGLAVEGSEATADDADDWPITDNATTAIFRIVQESLTNIARHANATRAIVTLQRTTAAPSPDAPLQPCYRIWVADNGVGVGGSNTPPHASSAGGPHARGSFGLIGMRERATLMGGVLRYGSPAEVRQRVWEMDDKGVHEPWPKAAWDTAVMFDNGFVICVTVPSAAIAREETR
ncbi:PAS domain S-box-containing protein [Robbsia andropogonis]|uniref:PAS domain-containing sensor histidine kinase n=1 Tax=Robbsia andropogonis TaxID=28092 RepID=UPI0004633DA9|nr:PAS domain-containing sensor histidine kinase [Robbsia andropogonis]